MDSTELLPSVLALRADLKAREKADRPAVVVPVSGLRDVMKVLCDDSRFAFDMLMAHTAVDWPKENRLELIYQLYSTSNCFYLLVSVDLDRSHPVADSMSGFWSIAEWQEREVYDLFGVKYHGHPDLRRLLLEDDWKGHPLLKDYQDDFMLVRPW